MDGSCGSFVFIRMDGNKALGEIFFFPTQEKKKKTYEFL
jgi:hypothetical protein